MSNHIILITGGAGFIGSHTVKSLLEDGFTIRVLDSLEPQIHGCLPHNLDFLKQKKVEFVRGSITNYDDIKRALVGVEYLIHLAAETGTGQSMYDISKYNFVNSQGTALLLNAILETKPRALKRIVLTSSRSVYGEGSFGCNVCNNNLRLNPKSRTKAQLSLREWEHKCPTCDSTLNPYATAEDDLIRPASIYAATKFAQEDLIRIVSESLGIDYAILRLQNVYGEGQSLHNPYTGILSIFSTKIRRNLAISIFEDGNESRDFIHVSDVVGAIRSAINCKKNISTVVNVGSGVATSVLEIAKKLTRALNGHENIKITNEYRVGDIRHNFADTRRLRNILNYVPSISLEDGLSRFADWVLMQQLPPDLLDEANEELRSRELMG
jgi:dTDP-L-rhamnose 4-epimerase